MDINSKQIERKKEYYVYIWFENNDAYKFSKEKRMIQKLHKHAEIITAVRPFNGVDQEHVLVKFPENSIVYMKSIFEFEDWVEGKRCPYLMRDNSKKSIDYILNNFGRIVEFYDNPDSYKKYFEILKNGTELRFDDTPQFNSSRLISMASTCDINDVKFYASICSEYITLRGAAVRCLSTEYRKKQIYLDIAKEDGKVIGRKKGEIINPEGKEIFNRIKDICKEFNGELNDTEALKELGISRNTLKKYKKIIKEKE